MKLTQHNEFVSKFYQIQSNTLSAATKESYANGLKEIENLIESVLDLCGDSDACNLVVRWNAKIILAKRLLKDTNEWNAKERSDSL